MASELIKYTDVEIHQAEQIVLTDVNLTVQAGEMIYLLGKVGSGKSSLMKTIYGALPIAAGSAVANCPIGGAASVLSFKTISCSPIGAWRITCSLC